MERLIIIGLPALMLSLTPVYIKFQKVFHIPISELNQTYIIFRLILGNVIPTSFYKKQ
jgi:hypothetical protein